MNALERAIKEDGHTREWYAQALGVPYWKVCRLIDGSRTLEYSVARRFAALLRRRFDDLFVPQPVREGRGWDLRFVPKGAGAQRGVA